MTYHGSEGCQGVKGGTQGAPAAAGGAKLLPPGGQSYFLSNGWSKSIVLENKVALNFDFRSRAKKSGHLGYHSLSKESPMCRALIPGILWELVILDCFVD